MTDAASRLVSQVTAITAAAQNEAQLRHELEGVLRKVCEDEGIPWTPFQLERALRDAGKPTKFADVAHGAVVIEYEPPKSFGGRLGRKAEHARRQAEEYASLLSAEEGRDLSDYVLVIWDGSDISFGRYLAGSPDWARVVPFDLAASERLLSFLRDAGKPLVHPQLLQGLVGPDSACGALLIPALFDSVRRAEGAVKFSKTRMLFTEWRRLFSQVVGFRPSNMRKLLARREASHGLSYDEDPAAYLFALNTYIAIVAKVVAGCTLLRPSRNLLDGAVPIRERLLAVETGELFEDAGISNMLSGDFFAWYLDDESWSAFEPHLTSMLAKLEGVDFTIAKKHPDTTRDLFKGVYERFIPREVRHALGEFYTPDWLAEHGMDLLDWNPKAALTDPTCGSGTILLEALRRRRMVFGSATSAQSLISGINGIDLNPLAVLAAKASLAVFLSPYLDPSNPIMLPVYLSDAINPARPDEGLFPLYRHSMRTEVGVEDFALPKNMIVHASFFAVFAKIRLLVDADIPTKKIVAGIAGDLEAMGLDSVGTGAVEDTVRRLVDLHAQGWNGIWCAILADRFAAGAIPPAPYVCGNPPWVKWSNLPEDYAKSIQAQCRDLGVFSGDRWVGGIEADISTVVTYQAISRYLAPGGRLGFFLPGSVFTTPSSAGFRRFVVGPGAIECKVVMVEDFDAVSPFDGVTNMPRYIVLERDAAMMFPIPYRVWKLDEAPLSAVRRCRTASEFHEVAHREMLWANPVPGGGSGRPWVVGTDAEQAVFARIFAGTERPYQARKGVTADRNGIYWVEAEETGRPEIMSIRNAATIGKTKGLAEVTARVESRHLFPLLRGKGVTAFSAKPEARLNILVPQRGMHGDPDLALSAPLTFKFLNRFKGELERRSSLRRFQKGRPFYSLWSTGAYTFSPYKVLWREIGKEFAAAYVGSFRVGREDKPVVPDHKLYFIPVGSLAEAAFLTGFLNAPMISRAVSAYASQLSLGVSVADYLDVPLFDPKNNLMSLISKLAIEITEKGEGFSMDERAALDCLIGELLTIRPTDGMPSVEMSAA